MTLWTSDKYIASIKKLSLSQKQTLNHGGSAQTAIRTNMHICVPVLIPCPISGLIWVLSSYITSAKGVILVYTQCVGDILVYTQCAGGYIQREHPWRGYIPGEKPYQSEYGTTDG